MSAADTTDSAARPQAALPPPPPTPPPSVNFAPKPPENGQSGAKFPPLSETKGTLPATGQSPQPSAPSSVVGENAAPAIETRTPPATGILQHLDSGGAETGEERALIAEGFALLVSEVRRSNRGRPTVIDEPMKARIATLMGAGLSLRQAAACLGINHTTISRAVLHDKQLKHDIDCARTRATLHPLACILREAGRNWKAAVWLLDHLEKIAYHEKTPLERAEGKAVRRTEDSLANQLAPRMLAESQAALGLNSPPVRPRRPPR
jgi:hypothetical protein